MSLIVILIYGIDEFVSSLFGNVGEGLSWE